MIIFVCTILQQNFDNALLDYDIFFNIKLILLCLLIVKEKYILKIGIYIYIYKLEKEILNFYLTKNKI